MNIKFLWMLLFAFSCAVLQAQDIYLDYRLGGSIDSTSEKVERYELDFDRQMTWFSNSTGGIDEPDCSSDVAHYQGEIKQADVKELAQKARAAIKSLKPEPGPGVPVRGFSKRLKLVVGDEALSGNLASSEEMPAAWAEMEELFNRLGKTLAPKKMLNMSARSLDQNRIQVRFQYFGKEPFLLMLPLKAQDAFVINGYELEYGAGPAQEMQQMGRARKVIDVTLKLKAVGANAKATRVYYSNKQNMHHAQTDATQGHLRPDSANLCSIVKRNLP
jgi:hypothetical protein